MKLYGARVFVADLETARDFYLNVLDLPLLFDSGDAFGLDLGISLIVEPVDDDHIDLAGRFTGLSIATDDIEANVARLSARGVSFLGAPERQTWGGTLAHFTDPGGNILSLVSP